MKRRLAFALVAGALAAAAPRAARACDVLRFDFMPGAELQIAVWLTDAAGNYVDTVKVTRLTATFGVGNRPGMPTTDPRGGFESNYHWPYGKRLEVLPVWAWGRGVLYPAVVMQDGMEDWLGFHNSLSSDEPYYCKPQTITESGVDMSTCASEGFNSDKGILDPTFEVPYPPRNDLSTFFAPDSADAPLLAGMNDLDAVTLATPAAGDLVSLMYDASALPPGDYLAWIEANEENDPNGSWWGDSNPGGSSPLPCLHDPLYPGVGVCLHGQPSVVWSVAFTVSGAADTFTVTTLDYAGYGAPTGADGAVSPPDATITTGVDGTGAGRLLAMNAGATDFRFGVACNEDFCPDGVPPDPIALLAQVPPEETAGDDINEATLRVARIADDDGDPIAGYEIRYAEGVGALDAATFTSGVPGPVLQPGPAGSEADVVLAGLRAGTTYTVGVRAQDECLNWSAPAFVEVTTEPMEFRTVTPCGCAAHSPRTGAGAAGTALVLAATLAAAGALRGRRRR